MTGTTKDTSRLALAKELGADFIIDVQKTDPLEAILEITKGRGVDVSIDCTAGAGTAAMLLGLPAAVGAYYGVALQQRVPVRTLSILFAVLVLAIAGKLFV